MRIFIVAAAVFALVSGASAKEHEKPSAFIVSPIHEAQIVRGDDGMDHVEYDLLVVSVLRCLTSWLMQGLSQTISSSCSSLSDLEDQQTENALLIFLLNGIA